MFTNTHPATTLILKSATLAQVQSEDKTCDWMAKDDYRNLVRGGGGDSIGFGSFWPLVVSDMSRFGRGSFRPSQFGLGRFGLILGWVVSAYFGWSFRPDIPLTPPPPLLYVTI